MPVRIFIAALVAMLALPTMASAATYNASYSVPDASWSFASSGGPYTASGFVITGPPGNYGIWSYGAWRFNAPPNTRLVSGTFSGTSATPAAGIGIRANVNAVNGRIYTGMNDGNFTASFNNNHAWAELALFSDSAIGSSRTNIAHITGATFTIADDGAPALAVNAPAAGWYGPGCVPFTYGSSDNGSGVWATSATNTTTGASVDTYQASAASPAVPGIAYINRNPCVAATRAGTNTINVATRDYAGNTVNQSFNIAFDLAAPTIHTNLADQRVTSDYRPAMTFAVDDTQSGVASTSVILDGAAVNATTEDGVINFTPAADLSLGNHKIVVTATDTVGNRHSIERRFTIRDTTAPAITIASPASSGGNKPILDATASDDKTGIDPASWVVTVNGQQVASYPQDNRVLVDLGYLVNQTHTITVSVKDKAGNPRSTEFNYQAKSQSSRAALPGIDGLYIVQAPRKKVKRGQVVRIRLAGIAKGRPLTGMRAEIRQRNRTIAGKPIAADGTVDIQARLYYKAPLVVVIDGSGLKAQKVVLKWR